MVINSKVHSLILESSCSIHCLIPQNCYRQYKRIYEQKFREIELGSFIPTVLSTVGRMGNAAMVTSKQLTSLIATKHSQSYSHTMA